MTIAMLLKNTVAAARARGEAQRVKRTPLYDAHRALGARMVDFAGWEMPVQYTGIIDEHTAVRTRAGLFDVSHMGEIELRGAGALAACQRAHRQRRRAPARRPGAVLAAAAARAAASSTTSSSTASAPSASSSASTPRNASSDFAWICASTRAAPRSSTAATTTRCSRCRGRARPRSWRAVRRCRSPTLPRFALRRGRRRRARRAGRAHRLHRRGRLGALLRRRATRRRCGTRCSQPARRHGISPAGLGARDTLRLEAALPLYGHELGEDTSPLEARLGWVVRLDKGDFVGRAALLAAAAARAAPPLVGLELDEPGIPRAGYRVLRDGQAVGE